MGWGLGLSNPESSPFIHSPQLLNVAGRTAVMGLKLQVRVLSARQLATKSSKGNCDSYCRVQLGKVKAKSHVVHKTVNPEWDEEFILKVEDLIQDELSVTIYEEDFFRPHDFLGQIIIPLTDVVRAEGNTITPTWYPLQKKSTSSKARVTGMDVEQPRGDEVWLVAACSWQAAVRLPASCPVSITLRAWLRGGGCIEKHLHALAGKGQKDGRRMSAAVWLLAERMVIGACAVSTMSLRPPSTSIL